MNSNKIVWLIGSLICAALLLTTFWAAQPAQAQSAVNAKAQPVAIQNIDVSAFPVITATVAVRGAAQGQLDQIRLLEDAKVVAANPQVSSGSPLAVAFLFDLSVEATDEMGNLRQFVRDLTAALPKDTLYALYEPPAAGGNALPVQLLPDDAGPFYPDRNALLNRLDAYIPQGPNDTPLLEMVQAVQLQLPAGADGHIIVITGPVPSSGTSDLGIVLPGCRNGVHVHAHLIKPESFVAGNAPLLASLTAACAGANTLYTEQAAAVTALHARLVKSVQYATFVYRTQQQQPRFLKVEIAGQPLFAADQSFPVMKPTRVAIAITEPFANQVFTVSETIDLFARVEVTPYPLRVTKVEYAVGANPRTPLTAAADGFRAQLSELPLGEHTLTVWATDELGNENKNETRIVVRAGPPPPPEMPAWVMPGLLLLAVLAVAAAAGGFAWKWWASQTPAPDGMSACQLVLVEQLPRLPKTITLHRELTVLGRDAAFATVVLEDDRISRKQCTIRRSRNRFLVQNHSGVNSTLLNGKPLPKDGPPHAIEHGAILTLGPARYRFDLPGGTGTGHTQPMSALNGVPPTVPLSAAIPQPAIKPAAKSQPMTGQPANGQPVVNHFL